MTKESAKRELQKEKTKKLADIVIPESYTAKEASDFLADLRSLPDRDLVELFARVHGKPLPKPKKATAQFPIMIPEAKFPIHDWNEWLVKAVGLAFCIKFPDENPVIDRHKTQLDSLLSQIPPVDELGIMAVRNLNKKGTTTMTTENENGNVTATTTTKAGKAKPAKASKAEASAAEPKAKRGRKPKAEAEASAAESKAKASKASKVSKAEPKPKGKAKPKAEADGTRTYETAATRADGTPAWTDKYNGYTDSRINKHAEPVLAAQRMIVSLEQASGMWGVNGYVANQIAAQGEAGATRDQIAKWVLDACKELGKKVVDPVRSVREMYLWWPRKDMCQIRYTDGKGNYYKEIPEYDEETGKVSFKGKAETVSKAKGKAKSKK